MSREQVLSALASGQVLKPLDSLGFPGQWGCLPIPAGGTLVGCDLRELDRLLIEGLIERVPDFGYVLARNPPAPVSAHARAARGSAMRHPVAPYSFSALLEREADIRELSTVFHLHIPKAGGGTVHTLLRQNNFTALDFDMSDQSFFGTVMEEVWANIQLTPAPRRRFALTGHFRLDAPFLRVVWVPHVVIATLRDPIKRLLSHYNFTQLVPGNPHHEALRTGKMSLVEYAEWLIARNSIGPQYSFFDDTGAGTFAYSGHGSPETCLNNLLNKVSLFGFTDRFEEFCILFGYLLRKQHIAVAPDNDTAGLDVDAQGLKSSLTSIEQAQIEKLYADDIWFFAEARKVYDQRIADPRIQAVLRQAAARVREVIKMLEEIREIRDPVDAAVRAFSLGVGEG